MRVRTTSRRTDLELVAILDDVAEWAMRDAIGTGVAHAASLRKALAMASELGRDGPRIVALMDGRVIVFNGQMDRLLTAAIFGMVPSS